MDRQPLVSIRTFAKDLEAKKHQKADLPATASDIPGTKRPSPVVAPIIKTKSTPVYTSPQWTTKIKPSEPKPIPKQEEKQTSPIREVTDQTKNEKTTPANQNITGISESDVEATILTDKKRNSSFKLFPAIGHSLKNWFKGVNDKYFTKKTPRYTVADTSLRKGVIQKATSKTGKLETFDHQSLQAKIKARENRVGAEPAKTIWTANTEPGYALLDGEVEVSKITNVEAVPRRTFTVEAPKATEVDTRWDEVPAQITEEPKPIVEKKPEVLMAKPEPIINPEAPRKVVLAEPIISPNLEVEEVKPELTTEVLEVVVPVEVPVPTTTPKRGRVVSVTKIKPSRLSDWLFSTSTNALSLGTSGLILAMIVTGAFGYLLWSSYKPATPTLITQINVLPEALEAPLQPIYTDNLSREAIFAAIIDNQKNNQHDIFYLVLVSSPTGKEVLPAISVISSLNLSLRPAFANSIKNIYFGSLRQSNPFIILDATDKAMSLGGMLAWEDKVIEDLAPIIKSFKPNLSTDNVSKNIKDEIVLGNDTRVITDLNDEILLAYTITSNNKILITDNISTLMSLINLVK